MKKLAKAYGKALGWVVAAVSYVVGMVAVATVYPVSKSWHLGRIAAESAMQHAQQAAYYEAAMAAAKAGGEIPQAPVVLNVSTGAYL